MEVQKEREAYCFHKKTQDRPIFGMLSCHIQWRHNNYADKMSKESTKGCHTDNPGTATELKDILSQKPGVKT
eukprot:10860985-Heterocapsa_arctica.AAC.1